MGAWGKYVPMLPDFFKGTQTIINSLVVNPAMNLGMQSLIDYGFQGIVEGRKMVDKLKNLMQTYKSLKTQSQTTNKSKR